MKTIEIKGLTLLPPRPDVCQECARDHTKEMPHDATSLYYQTKFNLENGRAATWMDAMAHCSDEMKKVWRECLSQKGIDVDGGQILPAKLARAK